MKPPKPVSDQQRTWICRLVQTLHQGTIVVSVQLRCQSLKWVMRFADVPSEKIVLPVGTQVVGAVNKSLSGAQESIYDLNLKGTSPISHTKFSALVNNVMPSPSDKWVQMCPVKGFAAASQDIYNPGSCIWTHTQSQNIRLCCFDSENYFSVCLIKS